MKEEGHVIVLVMIYTLEDEAFIDQTPDAKPHVMKKGLQLNLDMTVM